MGIDPERIRAAVRIYRHKRSGRLEIQPMRRRGRLGLEEVGSPTTVESDDDQVVASSVEEALAAFGGGPGSPTETETRFSPKEYSRFVRERDSITVVRLDEGLRLTPWERIRGGYASTDEASIALPVVTDATTLANAVRAAFERASGSR
jgi:hypothetical protein